MKTRVKRGVIAASLACVALSSALCLTTGSSSASAEEVPEPVNNLVACEQVLRSVGDDLASIVAGYNKLYENANWAASEIEYSSLVFLIEDNEYGIYLDFDADNGYAVVTTDKKIYGLEPRGDLEYLRDEREVYYSYIDGFMYVDENERLQKYEKKEYPLADDIIDSPAIIENDAPIGENVTNTSGDTRPSDSVGSDSVVYPGQSEAGDGNIDPSKINEYVRFVIRGSYIVTKTTKWRLILNMLIKAIQVII